MQALRVVLQEEECRAMEVVRRDLERARMTAEDLRGAVFSLTSEMGERMSRAEDLIEEARADALRAADSTNANRSALRVALISTNNLLVDAVRALHDEDSENEEMSDGETGDTSDSQARSEQA